MNNSIYIYMCVYVYYEPLKSTVTRVQLLLEGTLLRLLRLDEFGLAARLIFYISLCIYGWLSNLCSPFGSPKYQVP